MQNSIAGQHTENVESAMEFSSRSSREAMYNHVSESDRLNPNAEACGLVGYSGLGRTDHESNWPTGTREGELGPTGDPCGTLGTLLPSSPFSANRLAFLITGTYHSHPSGVCPTDPMQGWNQKISDIDWTMAQNSTNNYGVTGTHYMFSMRTSNVTLFNSRGYEVTMSFSTFLNIGK